jgi:ATP-dependent Clp protease adaptor protein ClpS
MAVIYNNETNTFDEVIEALMVATNCDLEEAQIETWEAHTFGKAPVHFDSRTTCEGVAAVLKSFGIRTDVEPEWKE